MTSIKMFPYPVQSSKAATTTNAFPRTRSTNRPKQPIKLFTLGNVSLLVILAVGTLINGHTLNQWRECKKVGISTTCDKILIP